MPHLVRIENHTFIADSLDKNAIVVDLGGNLGRFSTTISSKYHCKCFVAEPDPAIFSRVPDGPLVAKSNVAIGGSDGTMEFFRSDNIEGGSLKKSDAWDGRGVIAVKVQSLATFLGHFNLDVVDLLKVDIEGAEIPMLMQAPDESLRKQKQITVEFHDFMSGSVTREEVDEAIERMAQLGFWVIPFSVTDRSDVLFVRKDRMSYLTYLRLRYVSRWTRAIARRIRRRH